MPQVVTEEGSCFCALAEIVIPVMGLISKDHSPLPQCVLATRLSVVIVVPSVALSKSMYIEAVSLSVIVMVADAARVLSLTDVAVNATVAGVGALAGAV